ncbi:MAG: bifunctional phosphoribosylaminoimidazolecarboxamide formyltransferase/IMP cyclohydrolase [Rhodobacteraceae bacterium]|nr:bifunctional phosphoribosylaminoimidazolecarboxamide formyltransferase/IMP cyclohydrolase [Paracoccaceae bacterium]
MSGLVAVRRALVSVADKGGLLPLARALAGHGVEIVSTGGTAAMLRAEGFAPREVSELTGLPEMLDGRVKTLHPGVHAGLLARRDAPAHMAALAARGLVAIDLVVANLYPFEARVAAGADPAACIEEIDIGGPAMLRAAAKNAAHVAVVTDPEDYPALVAELAANGGSTTEGFRARLALTAFGRTAAYDAAVAEWLAATLGETLPRRRVLAGRLARPLRYGENPHQRAALYLGGPPRAGAATARQLQGKALSYNNLADADAAWELVAEFPPGEGAACVIVKHANPCGVARAGTAAAAFARALDGDRTSAFGGIVALNVPLDGPAAAAIAAVFTEVVIAPGADAAARAAFAARPNLRLLEAALPDPAAPGPCFRQVAGGILVQDRDAATPAPEGLRCVTRRPPTVAEAADLALAWTVVRHVTSNAIVLARGGATVGVGAGQMSRVDATRIAARKAEDMGAALGLGESLARGAAAASDAFFPFPDGIEALAAAGATAVIQPGGALRDGEVIAAADALGLAMVFTGVRHFRH